ncbi:carboxyltransferase domain-containing protein [Achromobacter ruhlandii]|uniref:Carboxyltransferase domain-containing protein n=1 Tax=Achromobacter ruhlandii TaxID=72557 RepID=A0A848NMG8_9BURK|nr:carboxyltransferase domain-containing protein [Achromobacter ruhlandii]
MQRGPWRLGFGVGFAPGRADLGVDVEKRGRRGRASPRTAVPPGAVAIANRQTVIYPNRLPGGWHIIGTTPLTMFDPARDPAAYLQPGDSVRFVPITPDEFQRLREARP